MRERIWGDRIQLTAARLDMGPEKGSHWLEEIVRNLRASIDSGIPIQASSTNVGTIGARPVPFNDGGMRVPHSLTGLGISDPSGDLQEKCDVRVR
jgi:hypothetical protein